MEYNCTLSYFVGKVLPSLYDHHRHHSHHHLHASPEWRRIRGLSVHLITSLPRSGSLPRGPKQHASRLSSPLSSPLLSSPLLALCSWVTARSCRLLLLSRRPCSAQGRLAPPAPAAGAPRDRVSCGPDGVRSWPLRRWTWRTGCRATGSCP